MRKGVLTNLAVTLAVSGALLSLVFWASMDRALVEQHAEQAGRNAQSLANRVSAATTTSEMWDEVRNLCRSRTVMGLFLYDHNGELMGGCGLNPGIRHPDPKDNGRHVTLQGNRPLTRLLDGAAVGADLTKNYRHGVRTVRAIVQVPSVLSTTSWKFFVGYLALTQAAIFFLGYFLFHRTIVGPIRRAATVAGRALGATNLREFGEPHVPRGDIQTISSSLTVMVARIVEDRDKMQALIQGLQRANADLEAAHQGLARSEKMATVGRLAAGVAHEVGNPLQVVIGYRDIIERGVSPEKMADILGRMDGELKRIHETLTRLLEFARPLKKDVRSCRINTIVGEAAALLEGRKGFRRTEFHSELDESIPSIESEPEKIRQILVNLIFNAADALPETGGRIELQTRDGNSEIEISVRDNGHGIPEADLSKIFDPFFTTKEPGKGTGLGLAVSLSLAESMGGSISIESIQRKGTTALLRLPKQSDASSVPDDNNPGV